MLQFEKTPFLMHNHNALILPHGISPEKTKDIEDSEYWIGKIREIRAFSEDDVRYSYRLICRTCTDATQVWIKVQWYYKPEDVASIVKSL